MSRKYKFIFSAIVVAFLSIAVGLAFVYFGNQDIDAVPQSLEVQKIDSEYCLVAQYNEKYSYRFSIEQKFDDSYYMLSQVDSDTNKLILKEQNLNVVPGNVYRFAVCYLTENKLTSEQSQTVEWVVPNADITINYNSLELDEEMLLWDAVDLVDRYIILCVNDLGETRQFTSVSNMFNLSSLRAGNYRIYVAPYVDAESKEFQYGAGKVFTLRREGQIISARLSDNDLIVTTNDMIERFEVYVNDVLLVTFSEFSVSEQDGIEMTIQNCAFLFDGLTESDKVEIRGLATQFLSESTLVQIIM